MDSSIDIILAHRDFNLALQPLPGRGQTDAAQGYSRRDRPENLNAPKPKKHKPQSQHSTGAGKGKYKGASKGKGKGNTQLPAPLRVAGAAAADAEGAPICFSYNLGGCSAAPPGGRCPKGRHICILSKCAQAAHSSSTEHR